MTRSTKTVKSTLNYRGKTRHLLVFMDGTWNDENGRDNDGITTNIYKLFRALDGELIEDVNIPHVIKHKNHIALYFRGIGNDDDNNMLGSFHKGIFGGSEKRIRDHAYVNIVKHYRRGDKISIFGFSRGAATARLLASDIEKEGIAAAVKIHSKDHINESTGVAEIVYKKYSDISDTRQRDVPIEFLGIFDTVGAFGIPIDIGFGFQKINLFKDLTVARTVKKVVHCVSIDESRKPFIPTLCNRGSNVEEVWFSGVHADIGGGYRLSELGRIPLSYMLNKLSKAFVDDPIAFNPDSISNISQYDLEDNFYLHYHGDGTAKDRRMVAVQDKDEPSARYRPKLHHSVLHFMASTTLQLSTPLNSFSKLEPIQYSPKGVYGLLGKYQKVN